jgi:hypothetical protein
VWSTLGTKDRTVARFLTVGGPSRSDIDLDGRQPSQLIMTAARVDPEIVPALGPYLSMTAGPSSLEAVEPRPVRCSRPAGGRVSTPA